jgi:hypothetical protein
VPIGEGAQVVEDRKSLVEDDCVDKGRQRADVRADRLPERTLVLGGLAALEEYLGGPEDRPIDDDVELTPKLIPVFVLLDGDQMPPRFTADSREGSYAPLGLVEACRGTLGAPKSGWAGTKSGTSLLEAASPTSHPLTVGAE